MLTKKAPILIHDVDVSPYDEGYEDHRRWLKDVSSLEGTTIKNLNLGCIYQ